MGGGEGEERDQEGGEEEHGWGVRRKLGERMGGYGEGKGIEINKPTKYYHKGINICVSRCPCLYGFTWSLMWSNDVDAVVTGKSSPRVFTRHRLQVSLAVQRHASEAH